jgi:hypothetical protein
MNYLTHTLIEQVFWTGIAPQVNRWRKQVLGLVSVAPFFMF